METNTSIRIKKTTRSRIREVDWDNLEFGNQTSDHMFVCTYDNGAWHDPAVIPFQNLSLSPTTLALHYGQSIFEGMKAFKKADGSINIFRIDKHYERFNRSLARMCMPEVPEELFKEALTELLKVDAQWMPAQEGAALYIRPFVFASEARFGVKVSEQYQFIIFTGPVCNYYEKPLRVKVERNFIRAAKGGTGYAKCCGNYGGAFYPTQLARREGYDQVLWTDARENKWIEESGTMNVFFVMDDTLVTPPLSDSILDGVTRDTLLQIAKDLSIPVEERPVSVTELIEKSQNRNLREVFGAGTAAVVAPISVIGIDGRDYQLPAYSEANTSFQLKRAIEAIRRGEMEDTRNWNFIIQ